MNNKILIFSIMLLLTLKAFTQTLEKEKFHELSKKITREKDKSIKAQLLYEAAQYYLEKEVRSKKDVDSAALLNNQSIKLSNMLGLKKNIARSMLFEGKIAVEREDLDLAIQLKNKAIIYANNNNLKKEEADAYQSLADDFFYKGDFANSTKHFNKAISLYRQIGASYDEAETFSLMANAYQYEEQLELSTKYAKQAIQIKKRIKRGHIYKELYYLSYNALLVGNFDEALAYLLESEKRVDNTKDNYFKMLIYSLLGSIYGELQIFDKSIVYNKKALVIAKKLGNSQSARTITENTAGILGSMGSMEKTAEALALLDGELHYKPGKECNVYYSSMYLSLYCTLKQFDKGKPYYENLLRCNNKDAENNSLENSARRFDVMIHYLIGTKQAYKAYPYADSLRKLAKQRNNKVMLAGCENTFFRVDSAVGNYLGAIRHLQNHKYLSDSLFNIDRSKQYADLLLKYETEKKEKNIKLLNSQNQLIHIKSEKAQRTKNITFIGIALLLIIVGLLYSRYRIKQKSNLKLEANQRELDQKNTFLETLNNEQDKLLKEKEWLIKEVHHRVKNNLQMVTSLLYSQSVYLKDDAAKLAINDSLRRMQAMALIHQKLYQEENTSKIAMAEYINDLAGYLNESFDAGNQIKFIQDIEAIYLDVSQAIPLGLIVTESIVNAIKYAFIDERKGMVKISLKHDGNEHLVLKIADDGIGLPTGSDTIKRNSLGLDLMQGLAKQLNGEFSIENNKGVHITVRFIILK